MASRPKVYFDRKRLDFIGLEGSLLDELKKTYAHADVDAEIAKMKAWLLSERGVKHKGTLPFVTRWLANAKRYSKAQEFSYNAPTLEAYMAKYLGDLWKKPDVQVLFAMNMRSRVP